MRRFCVVLIVSLSALLSAQAQVEYLSGHQSGIGGQVSATVKSDHTDGFVSASLAAGISGVANVGVTATDVPYKGSFMYTMSVEGFLLRSRSTSPWMIGTGVAIGLLDGDQNTSVYAMVAKRFGRSGTSFVQPSITAGLTGIGNDALSPVVGLHLALGFRSGKNGVLFFIEPEASVSRELKYRFNWYGYYGSVKSHYSAVGTFTLNAGLVIPVGGQ